MASRNSIATEFSQTDSTEQEVYLIFLPSILLPKLEQKRLALVKD
jgi:hypothetical protein